MALQVKFEKYLDLYFKIRPLSLPTLSAFKSLSSSGSDPAKHHVTLLNLHPVFTFQIVSVSGSLFALNSSLLMVYKSLARRGGLTMVRAERVSPDKIPLSLLM